eukprot:gnl/TRDRNA2_/TRDRNA2_72065_c0_seq1.p1 gnl/TRDRNA2_/TRDRNA2_72065_c0~~gnl/TRDRNA2_/TRDRNA2_72065_c0_seq1.p1  ORF type:complete len:160 (-),score=33.10 gnl/TRDRNA2_/TRDRNA2_72065_c0_seq1:18-497(-)
MANRLPPFVAKAKTDTADACPESADGQVTTASYVRWLDVSAVRFMVSDDPESGESVVMLFHSCANERIQHMCRDTEAEAEDGVGCLRYEAAVFMPALRALEAAGSKFVRCGDLPLAKEADRIALCEDLRQAGLLELSSQEEIAKSEAAAGCVATGRSHN